MLELSCVVLFKNCIVMVIVFVSMSFWFFSVQSFSVRLGLVVTKILTLSVTSLWIALK